MKSARITDPHACEAIAVVTDDDISAVQEEEAMAAEVAYIERVIDEVDRELAAQERAEHVRRSRSFTDQVRARRAHRRGDREVLRALPVRLDAPLLHVIAGEAA